MTDVCKESKLLPVLSSLLEDGEVLIEVQSGVLGLLRALANSSKSDGQQATAPRSGLDLVLKCCDL